jgi:hypothetical protein
MLHGLNVGIVSAQAAAYLIEQSLLFDGAAYLSRTPSVAGNRKTWTYSVWVKGNLGILLGHRVDGSNYDVITFGNVSVWGGYIQLDSQTAGTNCRLQSSALFRDPSAWYHIVVSVDTTQATAANRVKFYVNGTEITAFGTSTYPSLNFDFTYINNTVQHGLGTEGGSPNTYFNGLMALPILVDGAALDYTSFAEIDAENYINPKEYTGSYGNNGFQLDYADSSWFGLNVAGNDDQTALSASTQGSGDYDEQGSAWTVGSGTLSRTATINAIRSNRVLTGDFSISITMASGATSARVGVYAANEDGTYSYASAGAAGGMDSMTNSFYANFGGALFYKGSTSTVSVSQTNGAITITRVSGTITINTAGGNHTFSATYTGPMRFAISGGGTTASYTGIAFTSDGQAGNSFFDSGFATTDQLADTPTDDATLGIGNYATWNPLISGGATLSLANKRASIPADKSTAGTIAVNSGKWRFQAKLITLAGTYDAVGIAGNQNDWDTHLSYSGGHPEDVCTYQADGRKAGNSAYTAYGSTFTTNDVIDVFFDADTGTVWFAKNGTLQASATETEVQNGTTTNAAFTGVAFDGWGSKQIYPVVTLGGSGTSVWDVEFDAAKFTYSYAGITSYLALATQNLPAPTIADGSEYFNTVLYTGNGTAIASGGNPVTGVGFQPDFIWLKDRTSSNYHQLYDVVRGAQNAIYSNDTLAEGNFPEALNSIDSNGFTLGNNTGCNNNTNNYVAWCWKAGGTAVTNTDGTITSSVSANPTAGFSIVTWTGTGVAATVGHGLGVPNDFMIFKSRSNVSSPGVVTSALGFTKDLLLEVTDAAYTRAAISNNTAPTSTVFSVGTDTAINVSGYTYVAYCWAEVEGFSKFGSYTGNGSAAGPFIYTGFRPAFVIIKKSSAAGTTWNMFDNKRNPFNLVSQSLWANASDAEYTYTAGVNFTSNGFYLIGNPSQLNASAATHIYAAFAESPFQGGTGATTQSRAR